MDLRIKKLSKEFYDMDYFDENGEAVTVENVNLLELELEEREIEDLREEFNLYNKDDEIYIRLDGDELKEFMVYLQYNFDTDKIRIDNDKLLIEWEN